MKDKVSVQFVGVKADMNNCEMFCVRTVMNPTACSSENKLHNTESKSSLVLGHLYNELFKLTVNMFLIRVLAEKALLTC